MSMNKLQKIVIGSVIILLLGTLSGAYYLGGLITNREPDESSEDAQVYQGYPRTIVDTANRTVTITEPVTRIVVLSSDGARAVRILGAEDKVVGISDTIKKFPFHFPVMNQKPVVGTWKEVDWEAVAKLEPDLVIAPATGSINVNLTAEKLEPFGITVVGLYLYVEEDYDQIFDELEKLSILLEREEEAARYIAWHDDLETRIQDFVEDKEKPKVFLTYTAGAIGKTSDISSYGPGTTLYTVSEMAGGRSITANETIKYPKVGSEWVLKENPDVIVMLCGNVFGLWENEAEPADLIDQLLAGKSWDTINATVNNQIYAVPWSTTNGLEHIYGVVLLAKIYHPELDIEPQEVYKEFLEDFLRVKYPEGENKVLAYSDSITLTT